GRSCRTRPGAIRVSDLSEALASLRRAGAQRHAAEPPETGDGNRRFQILGSECRAAPEAPRPYPGAAQFADGRALLYRADALAPQLDLRKLVMARKCGPPR